MKVVRWQLDLNVMMRDTGSHGKCAVASWVAAESDGPA